MSSADTVGRMSAPDAAHMRAELAAVVEDMLRGAPVWYRWGGSESPAKGLDCSGLVEWLCRRVAVDPTPDARATTDDLWRDLAPVATPEPGDLALYGRGLPHDPASHVMVVLEGGRVAGMSGGGSKTTTETIARKFDARLKAFPSHLYRRDFIGFRRLPLGVAK